MEKVKLICPVCGEGNPLEGRFCEKCGADMRSELPAISEAAPPITWRSVGAILAIGAVALALELGLELLRRRLQKPWLPSRRSMLSRAVHRLLGQESRQEEQAEELSLYGERVWEVHRRGERLLGVERFSWRAMRK
jgi:hypothetical protein